MQFNDESWLELTPMRVLALYLGTYVDSWEHLVSLHSAILAELPTTLDSSELLVAAKPKIKSLLENCEQDTVARQDVLMHGVVRNALSEFRQQLLPNIEYAQRFLAAISKISDESKKIIESYYGSNLRGQELSEKTGLSRNKIVAGLFKARYELHNREFKNQPALMDGSSLFPSLLQDFIQGQIDKDSMELLRNTLSNDFTKVAEFEYQWRIHIILLAAFTAVPFQNEKLNDKISAYKEKGINKLSPKTRTGPLPAPRARGKSISSSGNRAPSTNSSSPVKYFVIAGVVAVIGIMSFLLSSGNKPTSEPTAKPTSEPAIAQNEDRGTETKRAGQTSPTTSPTVATPSTPAIKSPDTTVEKQADPSTPAIDQSPVAVKEVDKEKEPEPVSAPAPQPEPALTAQVTPDTTEKQKAVEPVKEKEKISYDDYLKVRDGLYADVTQDRITYAESYLKKILNDPEYENVKDHIEMDMAIIVLHEKNIDAEVKGAELLRDGRKFILEEHEGRKIEVIKAGENEVNSVTDAAIVLESKLGTGRVTQEVQFKKLSLTTRASLARVALSQSKDAAISAAIYEAFVYKSGQTMVPDYQIKEWLKKAQLNSEHKAIVAYLEDYFKAAFAARNMLTELNKMEKNIGKITDNAELESMKKTLLDYANDLKGTLAYITLQNRQNAVLALVDEKIEALKPKQTTPTTATDPTAPTDPNEPAPAPPADVGVPGAIVYEWYFKDGLGPWSNNMNIANLKIVGSDMVGVVRNEDAYIVGGGINIILDEVGFIEVTMAADKSNPTELYFSTKQSNGYQKIGEVSLSGPGYQTLRFATSNVALFKGQLKSLRIDPINGPNNASGRFAIRSIVMRKRAAP